MLLCLTANHRNASFELLERLSIGAPSAVSALVESSAVVSGAVVLATCNRFEAYLEIDDSRSSAESAVGATISAMSIASGVELDLLGETLAIKHGDDVVRHLFSVSSGLESVVVGEDEISGQVQRALEGARAAGTTSSGLEGLFQMAAQTSRGVKMQTTIGGAGRSLVRLAIELASSRITDWREAHVLVVGTGRYARNTIAALRDRGVTDIAVFSPSGRAAPFATKLRVRSEPSLSAAIATADVIIACTTSMAIGASAIPNTLRRLLIDLGLPRNIDQAVATLEGIELLDLETISLHAPLEELHATSDARTIVGSAAARYIADQSIAAAVVAHRKHIFDLLDAEIARASQRGDANRQTEAALRHFAGALLHTPSVRARELARAGKADDFVAALDAIYGIRADVSEEAAAADIRADLGADGDTGSAGNDTGSQGAATA